MSISSLGLEVAESVPVYSCPGPVLFVFAPSRRTAAPPRYVCVAPRCYVSKGGGNRRVFLPYINLGAAFITVFLFTSRSDTFP